MVDIWLPPAAHTGHILVESGSGLNIKVKLETRLQIFIVPPLFTVGEQDFLGLANQ